MRFLKMCKLLFSLFLFSCGGLGEMQKDLYQSVPICVNSNAPGGDGTGRGWANAFRTLKDAIDYMNSHDLSSYEVWVAGSFSSGYGTAEIKKPASFYGGFKGTESRREERDIKNKTVLSGDVSQKFGISSKCVIIDGFVFTGQSSYVYAVYMNSFSQCTISNCDFTGNGTLSFSYQAIYCLLNCEITIRDSSFTGNKSDEDGTCLVFSSGSNVFITDSFISDNVSANGTVVNLANCDNVVIDRCTFKKNTSGNAALNIYNVKSLSISNCVFGGYSAGDGNSATLGTSGTLGISNVLRNALIRNSVFLYNTSSNYGAAVCIRTGCNNIVFDACSVSNNTNSGSTGGSIYINSDCTIKNSDFSDNRSNGGGGCLDIEAGRTLVSSSVFSNNTTIGGFGGAVRCYNAAGADIQNCTFVNNYSSNVGGAVYFGTTSKCSLFNSVFYLNNANNAGAVYLLNNNMHDLSGLTFYNNSASGSAGAVYFGQPNQKLYNSVFYDNSASADASMYPNSAVLYNCSYEGVISGSFTEYSTVYLTSSPFVSIDPASSSFLRPSSILVNAGTLAAGFILPSTDCAGKPRVTDGLIDIGAYERR